MNGGVNVGGHVVSSKPVQVDIPTGDIDSNYESRDSRPADDRGRPRSTRPSRPRRPRRVAGTATTVWLYNPRGELTVAYTTATGAGSPRRPHRAGGAAAACWRRSSDGSGALHRGVALPSRPPTRPIPHRRQSAWDWAFTWSENALTSQVLVGLGIAATRRRASTHSRTAIPLVTPVGNGDTPVTVRRLRRHPTTGALTDPNGNKYDSRSAERARAREDLRHHRSQPDRHARLHAPTGDLAAAWGQDRDGDGRAPGLDVGTGVPPLPFLRGQERHALHRQRRRRLHQPG